MPRRSNSACRIRFRPRNTLALRKAAFVKSRLRGAVGIVAQHGLDILKRLNRRPLKNGKPIENDGEAADFLAEYNAAIGLP
jgi:hypothetical protein